MTDDAELGQRFAGRYAGFFKFLFKSAYQVDCQCLQPLWLKDWTGEPRSVAASLHWFGKLRHALNVPSGFSPSPEDLDLSAEAARLVDLMAGLRDLTSFLEEIFDPEVVRSYHISEAASPEAFLPAEQVFDLGDLFPVADGFDKVHR